MQPVECSRIGSHAEGPLELCGDNYQRKTPQHGCVFSLYLYSAAQTQVCSRWRVGLNYIGGFPWSVR